MVSYNDIMFDLFIMSFAGIGIAVIFIMDYMIFVKKKLFLKNSHSVPSKLNTYTKIDFKKEPGKLYVYGILAGIFSLYIIYKLIFSDLSAIIKVLIFLPSIIFTMGMHFFDNKIIKNIYAFSFYFILLTFPSMFLYGILTIFISEGKSFIITEIISVLVAFILSRIMLKKSQQKRKKK